VAQVARGTNGTLRPVVAAVLVATAWGVAMPVTAQEAAAVAVTPMSVAAVQPVLQAEPQPLDTAGLINGSLPYKGKKLYVAEYRVLFEVSGNVRASTRAGYLPGRDYGASSVNVAYSGEPDIATLQAVVDRAWADFQKRMADAGVPLETPEAVFKEHGPAVYEASQAASAPGAPVYEEVSLGYGKRKYLVLAPTGMKTVPRGFAGIGAGNIGQRIAYSKAGVEGLSISPVINVAAQESSGSGSSIFNRGSTANARAQMELTNVGVLAQGHANAQGVTLTRNVVPPGEFAALREVGGYDSSKDPVVTAVNVLGRLALGVAGNNSKKVELAMDFDGPTTAKLALQGLATVNQAVANALK
jgi:hypothetical protein